MCNCRSSVTLYQASDGRHYESQTDTFRCGPVAVRNAFRRLICCAPPGPATVRRICTTCHALPKHDNGFGGTLPENMSAAVRLFWPSHGHVIGQAACATALRNPTYSAWIVLYTGLKPNRQRYFHYVFAWRDRRRYFVQNEMDASEYVVWDSQLEEEYLEERVHCDVAFPQVWVLS